MLIQPCYSTSGYLKKLTIGKYLIVFYLTIYSVNVLVFETLAIAHRMGDKPIFLLVQILFCGVILAVLKYWSAGCRYDRHSLLKG